MVKDRTKYNFNGKSNLPKNRLVLEVIKKYVGDNPNISFEELREIFPKKMQGTHEIVVLAQSIPEFKKVRYFLKKDEIIKLSDKRHISVTNQWGVAGNIKTFIKKATELGYEITEIENLSNEYKPTIQGEPQKYLPARPIEKRYDQPLNLILYGPPGTGKTYNTTAFAVRLIEGGDPFEIMPNLKNNELSDIEVEKFAELRKSGQIEFITFHQSYSYEDFVEGIKPDISEENDQMKFRLNDGIFKKICENAENNLRQFRQNPEERNKEKAFDKALESFIDAIREHVPEYNIPDSVAYIIDINEEGSCQDI